MTDIADILTRHGFEPQEAYNTEERWTEWLLEKLYDEDVSEHFEAMTITDVDQMIIVDNIDVDLMCPHHLLPVTFRVHVGYMPCDGKVLGLSKFGRIAQGIAKSQTQEEYTQKYIDTIGLGMEPHWAMAIVVGIHSCMTCRGIKNRRSETVTSAIWNVDYDPDGILKNEMIDFIGHNLRK